MSDNELKCQTLLTAVKKHTRTLNNLNASIKFLREDLVGLYARLEKLEKLKKQSLLYRFVQLVKGE